MKKSNRWAQAYNVVATDLTSNERMKRGEYIRRIKSVAPFYVGLTNLSLSDLHDVDMSINVCEINRIGHNLRCQA